MANDGRILVQATVIGIKDDQILYPSCKQCYSKLQREEYEKEWVCFKCSTVYEKSKLEWRYRLTLTVAEKTDVTDIALFGKTLEPYFGTSAEKFHRFVDKLDEDNLLEENMLLGALEETFVGQSFMFGIKSNARLKELQRYHGSMSPVCASTVQKVKLGDFASQSGYASDLVAVQILSSANVSFTRNTVLYNLQTITDLNWETKPLCSVGSGDVKSIEECSYLPYTTFDQSTSCSYLNVHTNSAVELSYEKSIVSCNQTTEYESFWEIGLKSRTKSIHEKSTEENFEGVIDESGKVKDQVVSNLKSYESLETKEHQKIKNKNNQDSRPKLSKKLCLNTKPYLETIERSFSLNTLANPTQLSRYSRTAKQITHHSQMSSVNDNAHGTASDKCSRLSMALGRNAQHDKISQDTSMVPCDSDLEKASHIKLSALCPKKTKFLRSFSKAKPVASTVSHDESSVEVMRNFDQEIKLHYDQSYLSYSDWDNSFNFSDLNSQTRSLDPVQVQSHMTMTDMPESENLDQFLSDASLLPIDSPERLQTVSSLDIGKNACGLSNKLSLDLTIKKKLDLSHEQLNEDAYKMSVNSCDMPESENLSKFLDDDSFDAQMMTEDFMDSDNEKCNIPTHGKLRCDHTKRYKSELKNKKCDTSKACDAKLNNSNSNDHKGQDDEPKDPKCDKPKNETNTKLNNCNSDDPKSQYVDLENSTSNQIQLNSSGSKTAELHHPFQADTRSSNSEENTYKDQSTYLTLEACLKEIESCDLVNHSFVSSQILLDIESKKVKQLISIDNYDGKCDLSANNPNFDETTNILLESNLERITDKIDSGHKSAEYLENDLCIFGDDSQGSMCLFSDDETSFVCVISNPQVLIEKPPTADIGSSQDKSIGQLQDNLSNSHSSSFKDATVDASTVLDLEVLRNASVNFNTDIFTESLFGDSISCSPNEISELLLAMDLKDVGVDRDSDQNLNHKDSTAEWGTDLENEDFLALDLETTNFDRRQNCDSVILVNPQNAIKKRGSLGQNTKQPSVIRKACLDLDFDSVDDSDILAMDCNQKHDSEAKMFLSKLTVTEKMKPEILPSEAETPEASQCKILSKDLVGNSNSANDSYLHLKTPCHNDFDDPHPLIDVTEDGSIDLFDCSRGYAASQSDITSQPQSMMAVDNSVLDTSEQFLNPVAPNLCLSKKVKFARRLSTVRHLNLVDIRLNMCRTSSPLTSTQNLKPCLRKSVQEAPCELDDSVFSQNVFSPSPVKSTRQCLTGGELQNSKQLNSNSASRCHNSTPVNPSSQASSVFSPDLFSPG